MHPRVPSAPEPDRELAAELSGRLEALLAGDDAERARRYPGPSRAGNRCTPPTSRPTGSPPAHPRQWGEAALGPWTSTARCPDSTRPSTAKVRAKLAREPVEDLRIDFEDGYGIRPDEVEDAAAVSAATALAELVGAARRAAVHRAADEVAGAGGPPPRAEHPGAVPGHLAGAGGAAGRLPDHPAQGQLGARRCRRWSSAAPCWSPASAWPPGSCGSRSRSRRRRPSSARTAPRWWRR